MTRQGLEFQRQRAIRSAQNQWFPPPTDVVKINFDGATCPKKRKAGIGVVISDVNGLVLASCAKIKHQPFKVVEIESLVIQSGTVAKLKLKTRSKPCGLAPSWTRSGQIKLYGNSKTPSVLQILKAWFHG